MELDKLLTIIKDVPVDKFDVRRRASIIIGGAIDSKEYCVLVRNTKFDFEKSYFVTIPHPWCLRWLLKWMAEASQPVPLYNGKYVLSVAELFASLPKQVETSNDVKIFMDTHCALVHAIAYF